KRELPRHFPLNAGQRHAHGAVQTKMIETPPLEVYERPGDVLVRVVTPRGRIGSGAAQKAQGNFFGDLPAKVAAVDGAQARRPRKRSMGVKRVTWASLVSRTSSSSGSP